MKNIIQDLYRRLSNAIETANCELGWFCTLEFEAGEMKEFMQYFSATIFTRLFEHAELFFSKR